MRFRRAGVAAAAVVCAFAAGILIDGCGGGRPAADASSCAPSLNAARDTAERYVADASDVASRGSLRASVNRWTTVSVEVPGDQHGITVTVRCRDGAWWVSEAQRYSW